MVHLFAIMAFIIAVCVAFKRRFEVALPLAALLLMLVLTPLGMLSRLSWVDGLAVATLVCVVALLITALLKKRITPSELGKRIATYVLTPGLLCFVCITVFWVYACQSMVVWWGDDIVHWALEPKIIWLHNGFASAAQRPSLYFATYTPGIPLLNWFAMHIVGEWQESVLYVSLYMFNAVLLMPLLQKLTWRKFYLIPVALVGLVLLPAWGNMFSYIFLGVDTPLALCFGYVLLVGFQLQKRDGFGMVSLALGLCGLVLIKQIGVLFAVMALVVLAVTERFSGQGRLRGWLCAAAPVAALAGWALYCHTAGLSGYHTSTLGQRLSELLSGNYVAPQGANDVLSSLMTALTTGYVGHLTLQTAPVLFMPKLLWLIVLIVAPLCLTRLYPKRSMHRLSLALAICTLVYLAVQYVSFFTVFYEETSVYVGENVMNMVALMERYMAPLMLGFTVLLLALLLFAPTKPHTKRTTLLRAAAAVCFTAVFALTLNWNLLYETLVPDRYCQQNRAIGAEAETLMDHDWGYALEEYENPRVLVGLEPNADYVNNLQYTFAFAKFELPQYAFVETSDALSEHLLQNGVTHVICFDDTAILYAPAAELTEDGSLYPWTLYEVVDEDGRAMLVEFY